MTFIFLKYLTLGLVELLPIILFLLTVIVLLGYLTGRSEEWNLSDSLYFAFVTATTVGYGDLKPGKKSSRLFAIFIAISGIILTGIIVAVSLYAVEAAFVAKKV